MISEDLHEMPLAMDPIDSIVYSIVLNLKKDDQTYKPFCKWAFAGRFNRHILLLKEFSIKSNFKKSNDSSITARNLYRLMENGWIRAQNIKKYCDGLLWEMSRIEMVTLAKLSNENELEILNRLFLPVKHNRNRFSDAFH